MSLVPSTPPGTPSVVPPQRHPGVWTRLLPEPIRQLPSLWRESQDPAGLLTLSTFSLSAISTTVALALGLGISPVPLYQLNTLLWAMHRLGPILVILPIAFGFSSARRLPRVVATFSILLTALFYTWYWLPWAGSPSTPIKVAYIAGALALAFPALVYRIMVGSSTRPRPNQRL